MTLSWKDAVGTLATAGVAAITYARVKGYDWPLVNSWRTSTLALLALGLIGCIVIGSGGAPVKGAWTTAASVLGGAAFMLGIIGVISGSRLIFLLVAADIVLLWAMTTMHHLLATGG